MNNDSRHIPDSKTCNDLLRIRILDRKTIAAKLEAEGNAYRQWLTSSPRYLQHQDTKKAFQETMRKIDLSIDECLALGEQGDYLVDLDRSPEPVISQMGIGI